MNNQVSLSQWNELMSLVKTSAATENQIEGAIYAGQDDLNSTLHKPKRKRFYCYDNYDRIDSPGFDLIINEGQTQGKLTVYNVSEHARAPVSFDQALEIAQNFFNSKGSNMAEEIVCEWVMDGNASTF